MPAASPGPTLFDLLPAPGPYRPAELEVLGRCWWQVHWGGLLFGQSGGLEGRVTKCRVGPVVFYVRENLARDHFNTSGGERMAMKRGDKTSGVDVLELCAPAAEWDALADLVREVDARRRPVRRNRRFTVDWAERHLAGRPTI